MRSRREVARAVGARVVRCLVLVAMVAVMVPTVGVVPAAGVVSATYWVDAVGGDDADVGTEIAPFKTITHALSVASPADTLMIQPGTYDEANGETFPLSALGESLMGVEGPEVTIVSGNGVERVLIVQSITAGDFVEGLTLENGGTAPGAGLWVAMSTNPTAPDTPRIENNVFRDNTTTSFAGAGLMVSSTGPDLAHPLIAGNTFTGNTCSSDGGGLKLYQHVAATVTGNTFEHNYAQTGGALSIVTSDATCTIEGNRFLDNASSHNGGAIYASVTGSAEHAIVDNLFLGNESEGNDGGALYLYGVTATLSGNDAGGNSASETGGFACLGHSTVTAENNVIGGCQSGDGGNAWSVMEAALLENNDTVADCYGADSATWPLTGHVEITNSIYWNPQCEDEFIDAALVAYTCISDTDAFNGKGNTDGGGNIFDDPMIIGGARHDPRLMVGSPCIDSAEASSAASVDFYGTARPLDGDADGTALPDMGACERSAPIAGSLAGDSRYETAVEIVMDSFDTCETAIIASGQNFPDALSAAGLAGAFDAPLLLVQQNSVPAVVAGALDDLGVSDVIVVGGTAAVSAAVQTALDASYDVERIAGGNRYDTAALVARRVAAHLGDGFDPMVFVARGDSFPDALAASPLAYAGGVPILLTQPGSLPAATGAALNDLDIQEAAVIGGTGAVSAAVKTQVDAVLAGNGGTASERWSGTDRYATAAVVADKGVQYDFVTWDYVGVATGQNYPDALAGGVGAGAQDGVVLLTGSTVLPSATRATLQTHGPVIMKLDVLGGPSAVSTSVRAAIEAALGW